MARSTTSAARSRSQLGLNTRTYGAKKRKVASKNKSRQQQQQTAVATKGGNPHVPSDWLARFPVSVQLLVQHAAKRGVALTLLAPGMSKRVRNTSHMDVRSDTLFWRVEWAFPSADTAVNVAEARADDQQTLFALLAQYLAKTPVRTRTARWLGGSRLSCVDSVVAVVVVAVAVLGERDDPE